MADDAGAAGGRGSRRPRGPWDGEPRWFRGGFGSRGRCRGPGWGRGHGARGGKAKDKEWMPVSKLGRLVKDMKITSLEEIYLFSLPIEESEIIDFFLGGLSQGYWGNKIGKPHTVPCNVTGRCGSVLVRLIRAPRGTSIVSAPVPKKLLMMAGIDDCYTSARGCTATLSNFAKATFDAISKTYSYLTPDLWKAAVFTKSPYQEFTDHLAKTHTRVSVQRTQAPAVATT
uniref:Small ribosomal subunit protein uS5 n=1 Tax=Nomascus leucogenys TaxID=61853 RepID=A0A2I3HGQ3_NOMLE